LTTRLFSPALVVYLDHVRANVRAMLRHVGGRAERWRPHVKTTKIPAVWAELAAAGIEHYKCATAREAAHLLDVLAAADCTHPDVLLAYPLVGPELARLGELARAHPRARVSILCEDPGALESIPAALSIFVDVNPGMHRTGIPLADTDTILDVARRAGPRFRGVHYYDGHLHTGGADERRRDVFACYDPLIELLDVFERERLPVGEVTTSGTPTFQHALSYEPLAARAGTVHRVSPGTVVYHDLRSEEENEGLALVPAALVFARVVSHPGPDRVTCDAGSKSIAAEAGDPCAYVLGHPELEARPPSEEHLPLRVTSGQRPPRGTELLLVPRHVCPTVNLAEEAVLIEGGEVRAVVPVAARAHELGLA
jgi:D-serine deaminase-like pyridoxal phosphate-dependent protein